MTFDYRSVMNGKRRDPLAMAMRGGLWIASWPYRWAVHFRNRKYDRNESAIQSCGVPVVSVGNLTTGGTGKTPIVCFLAQALRNRGLRVAIVSRGYGRGEADENDEAMELHSRLPDVPHVQNPDRVQAALVAVEELEAQVILMDDGLQHRRLHRDVNLIVIDATCPFGFGYLLPRGLLRESLDSLRRGDLVLLSRCAAVNEDQLREIESLIHQYHPQLPIVRTHHQPNSLLQFPDQIHPITKLAGQRVAVISAIGNPNAFETTVRDCGATVVDCQHLPDHDSYDPETMHDLRSWIQGLGDSIDQVVCTHKDLVKIRSDRIGGKDLAAILIELNVVSDPSQLDTLIANVSKLCEDSSRSAVGSS
ncbi:MAG: tetraacyldisaccharide 4'-kinase [Pirellulaceae bacterium]|nr:tetraacyldisaccharide 4'-kinase [Pirellulaceae bacterium]